MLRQHHRFFQTSQVVRDALVVSLAFWLAYTLRRVVPTWLAVVQMPDRLETAELTFILLLVWPWVGHAAGLYSSRRTRSAFVECLDVSRALTFAFVSLVTAAYFVRDVRYSRATLLLWMAIALPALLMVRLAQKTFLGRLRAKGKNLRHVLLVGLGSLSEQVLAIIAAEPSLGLRVVGMVGLAHHIKQVGTYIGGVPVVGCVENMASLLSQKRVDQVIVALGIEELGALKPLMAQLSKETVDVRLVPDLYQFMTLCGSVEDFFGMPLINLQSAPLNGGGRLIKRVFDMVCATAILLVGLPFLLLVCGAIWLEDRGAIFYCQRRIGLDGEAFWMFKFRTMRSDAEAQGAQMTAQSDPRCTHIGRLLRRFSIDELPQLLNVVVGHMSLVGPRPEQPSFTETFRHSIPRYALRHKIKAGMTGWAQVNGLRGNTSIAKRIELDLYYIENWSLALDVKILLRTACGGFLSPHAY